MTSLLFGGCDLHLYIVEALVAVGIPMIVASSRDSEKEGSDCRKRIKMGQQIII